MSKRKLLEEIEKLKKNQQVLTIKLNEVVGTIYSTIYNKALIFFSWFSWDMFKSYDLMIETKNKAVDELPNHFDIYNNDHFISNLEYSSDNIISEIKYNCHNYSCHSTVHINKPVSCKDRLGYLVDNYYLFCENCETIKIINAYYYLLEMLKKDKEIYDYKKKYRR